MRFRSPHNRLQNKNLRCGVARRCRCRAAFTLAELIVSMGILLLMLSLVGQVMNFTVKSTGQATALIEVSQALRVFEETLREDLRHVQPGSSLLLIQGNPVNAYWTQAGKDADDDADPINGYPHIGDPEREDPDNAGMMIQPRADILMFFTAREATNYVQYDYQNATPNTPTAITSAFQQVVYGHADLVEYTADDYDVPEAVFTFPTDPAAAGMPSSNLVYFPLPAQRWHLARRVVHLLGLSSPTPPVVAGSPKWGNALVENFDPDDMDGDPKGDLLDNDNPLDGADFLGNTAFLRGKSDVLTAFNYEDWVLQPASQTECPEIGQFPFYWSAIFEDRDYPCFARSQLDLTPPPQLADRLAHYFLPNCASFTVEWTLDPSSDFVGGLLEPSDELGDNRRESGVFWFDPGAADPLASVEDVIDLTTGRGGRLYDLIDKGRAGASYSMHERFTDAGPVEWREHGFGDGDRANLAVFAAKRRDSSDDVVPEEIFPAALRITVDMFDREGRLERPIRHVMVIPVGE